MANIKKNIMDPTRWRAYIKKIAKTYNQNENITQDLIQEGFIGVWVASQHFKGNSEKEWINYMTTIIKNYMKTFLLKYSNIIKTPKKYIKENIVKVISMNNPINENGDNIEDFIGEEIVEPQIDFSELKMVLNGLRENEQILLKMYFGIDSNDEPKNCAEIAKKFDCSRENIRQKLKKVLKKLEKNEKLQRNYKN